MNHKDLLSYFYIINFLNLPLCALIHDLQKKPYGHQLGPMTHFLTTLKFDLLLYIGEKCLQTSDLLSYFYIINFLNLPVRALIHDLPTGINTHDPFFDNSERPTFIYRGEVPAHTFAKRALINDPKKLFQKKVYVTIPQ